MPDTEKKLVQRADKVAFYDVADTFHRMKGFTSLATNKNPKEYTRQYVDELFETTDVVGISAAIDFAFDQMKNDPVHEDLTEIIDNEIIGTDAVREIMVVDFTKPSGDGFECRKRSYSIIPGTDGGSLDAYTYEGTFRVNSEQVVGVATSTDEWQTATFAENTEEPIEP